LANIKSQKKRNKTNEKSHLANVQVKSDLKTVVKKAREAVQSRDLEQAQINLKIASKKLDRAVTKGVIHANQAKQRKSKLQKALNQLPVK
jgi:small subunit ribosomal protein S20